MMISNRNGLVHDLITLNFRCRICSKAKYSKKKMIFCLFYL